MEIDELIQEKRSELKEAFASHQKAREAAANMQKRFSELLLTVGPESTKPDPGALQLAKAQLQDLDSAEGKAATRFKVVREELAQLHREKYGFCISRGQVTEDRSCPPMTGHFVRTWKAIAQAPGRSSYREAARSIS
jgi:hypothetical protein